MKIGIDVLGGDFAPDANLEGAILAQKELSEEIQIVLLGDQELIARKLLALNVDANNFEIVHAPDSITMDDHPTRAIPRKPNSSISIGFDLLSSGEIQAFASTGNTGAMLVGSMYKINTIPGVIRPCITSTLPAIDGSKTILLDVGSNADCKPDVLYQFAILGSLYSKGVYGVKNPKVALLNIGEEESKGNLLTLSTHRLLSESDNVNFIGNLEGRDLFLGKADVIVCDGFTGNVVLK
jgi:glycerol-3-phosphate acyltransferase PlsX